MSLWPKQPPLSLYIHIPWCVRKCPYCDFNSHESKDRPEAEYVQKCIEDMTSQSVYGYDRPLESIFFGGGTPSLFQPSSFKKLIQHAERTFGFSKNVEITMEANPGTTEYHDFGEYLNAGINRVSFGIQSFNDDHLRSLGRIHNGNAAINAYNKARNAGVQNINIDLMHGLPNQSEEQAISDLLQAIELKPNHISWYQLTIEPNTAFYNAPPQLPVEDTLATIMQTGFSTLAKNHYMQYEVSAFCLTGQQSKHNTNYWRFGDYIGIGAGAHGKISHPDLGLIRTQRSRQPNHYLESDFKPKDKLTKVVSIEEQGLEFMMNALRLVDGVPKHYLSDRTLLANNVINTILSKPTEAGLIAPHKTHIVTTPTGFKFLDNTLSYFA